MMYDDDEIRRIFDGATAPEPATSLPDPEVLAETVVRVDLGAFLGMLELYVGDRPDLVLAGEEPQVCFLFPDGGNLAPSESQKVALEIRVCDLELYLSAMQKALERARRMGVLPRVVASDRS